MKKISHILISAFLLCFSLSSLAHHSWRAVYGNGEQLDITAKVISVPQRNPHWFVTAEFADEDGEMQEWTLQWRGRRGNDGDREEDQIRALLRAGEDFQIKGQKSHISGNNLILIQEITRLSDGVTAVSSRD